MALGPGGGFPQDEMLGLRVEGRAGILEDARSAGGGEAPREGGNSICEASGVGRGQTTKQREQTLQPFT